MPCTECRISREETSVVGTSRNVPQKPTHVNDREGWKLYWMALGMHWRTEPEIDEARQSYLSERRAVRPNIEKGIYPFRDENGPIRLTRADVEWLLVTHMGGIWPSIWGRATPGLPKRGIALQGADLRGADLRRLPLMQMQAGLDSIDWANSSDTQRDAAAIHLEGANLRLANLQDAAMRGAHLEGANLQNTHLEGTVLHSARLGGMNDLNPPGSARQSYSLGSLRNAFMDFETNLRGVDFGDVKRGHTLLADARWVDADVTTVEWDKVLSTGDEEQARNRWTPDGKLKSKSQRVADYQTATRCYRQLTTVLRDQGLTEDADRFAYRASRCQRVTYRMQRRYIPYLGSLSLDLLAGYGYKPFRSLLMYSATILVFAILYWCVTNDISFSHGLYTYVLSALHMTSPPEPTYHLQGYEAVVVSMTSFHGRGFFQPIQSPGDKVAILSAIEAAVGLIIEIVFIATFTQRFLSR